ncbi:hypothetical protein IMZ48_47965, partial [Candidatus Bathyarchaeota archaeon]|nr:hypothetical protein [Candidatus Bathyarchaeota archaeon]
AFFINLTAFFINLTAFFINLPAFFAWHVKAFFINLKAFLAWNLHNYIQAPTSVQTLLKAFIVWKALLFTLVLITTFLPSYDTSTSLALDLPPDHTSDAPHLSFSSALASRLTRWDAIYFTAIAHRGYLHEQEWAFGPGLPYLVSKILLPLSSVLGLALPQTLKTAALLSAAVSNVSHLLSVLLLHALTRRLFPQLNKNLALTAGLLHIISPAGIFLSAPYAESLFACLSFAGYVIYLSPDLIPGPQQVKRGASLLIPGALFGLATACRTNGILNGVVFVVELVWLLHDLAWRRERTLPRRLLGALHVLVPTIVGGILVPMGSLIPQAAAYWRYCTGDDTRPWCSNFVPSIYAFVQEHYWYVPPHHLTLRRN